MTQVKCCKCRPRSRFATFPDETRDELAARAASSGRSLQEYLRAELIALADKPDLPSLLERIAARKRAVSSALEPERILELRDAERR